MGIKAAKGGGNSVKVKGIASANDPNRAHWNYSASEGQDKLVLEVLDNKASGFFVDLAARYWFRGRSVQS